MDTYLLHGSNTGTLPAIGNRFFTALLDDRRPPVPGGVATEYHHDTQKNREYLERE